MPSSTPAQLACRNCCPNTSLIRGYLQRLPLIPARSCGGCCSIRRPSWWPMGSIVRPQTGRCRYAAQWPHGGLLGVPAGYTLPRPAIPCGLLTFSSATIVQKNLSRNRMHQRLVIGASAGAGL